MKRTDWALEAAKKMSGKRDIYTIISFFFIMIGFIVHYILAIFNGATRCLN